MSNSDSHCEDMAAVFRVLSDPWRLMLFSIVLRMADAADGSGVGGVDLGEAIDEGVYATNAAPSAIEHNMMQLAGVGILRLREGSHGRLAVSVNREVLEEAQKMLSGRHGSM